MNKLSIADLNFTGKRTLVRVDFNVPLDDGRNITDDRRIVAALPTIKKIINDGGRLVLCSHLGRPKGKVVPEMSLKPVAIKLSGLIGKNVRFAPDCVGDNINSMVEALKEGEVLLLENLRFHKEETDNDPGFAKQLASIADIYVNDAFGTAHRAHASTEGVTKFIDTCAAGYLMEKEIRYLGEALSNPQKPFVAVLGGAKISGKIDVIENLMDKVDCIIIGGGMVFTFVRAMGHEIGGSLLEKDKVGMAADILKKARSKKIRFLLPVDCVVASDITEEAETSVVDIKAIPSDKKGLDIGPKSIDLFADELKKAKTVVWNGPMGVFEVEQFSKGTYEIARIMAEITSKGAVTIVGGGDSASAVRKCGLDDRLTHISTGGGASLEFLEGKTLPGVAALTDAKKSKVEA
jgi:phosphoglycerate kinase